MDNSVNKTVIGKIKSLALRDFLTYDELKFIPGDHLNIITGPNGTGKSSIVAAIILGCGGEPALLSRSKDVSDYVKNGKMKAKIEIEIVSTIHEDIVTFYRAFDKNSKEVYKINKTVVSRKEYLKNIKQLNIQVDNLCMFLPQDRVQDFTKMNGQQLLHNTQISVCSPEITTAFEKLLEIRKNQKSNNEVKGDIHTRLHDNSNRMKILQTTIESNRLKNELISKLDMLMRKKAWLECSKEKAKLPEIEADLKTLTDKIKDRNALLVPLKASVAKTIEHKTELKNAISKAGTTLSATTSEMEKLNDASDKIEEDINGAKRKLKNVIQSVQDHKKQVEEMKVLVNLERSELEESKSAIDENTIEKIKQLDEKTNQIKSHQEKLMNQRNLVTKSLDEQIIPSIRNCERKIATFSDNQKQQIDVLRNNFEDTYKAFKWLENNRDQFRGRIFNPVMVEITVNQKENAKYIENTVAIKDLTCFICTDKEDMRQLIIKLRNDMNLRVNVAYSEDTDEIKYRPSRPVTDYPQHLGLYSYLIDMFQGPAPIMNYLCRLYFIHNVVVGDDNTFKNASQIPNEFRMYFSTNHRYTVSISRYSQSKSMSSVPINDRNILNVGVDTRKKEREEQYLNKWNGDAAKARAKRVAIETQLKQNEELLAQVREEKGALQKIIQQIKICAAKLQKKEAEYEALVNRKIDVDDERNKFKTSVNALIKNLDKINEKRCDYLAQYETQYVAQVLAKKKLQNFDAGTGNVEEEIRKLDNEIRNTMNVREMVKDRLKGMLERIKTIEKEALKLTDGVSPDNSKFKYKKEFEKLSNDIEELVNSAGELEGRIDCILGIDPKIIEEYEALGTSIKDLEKQLQNENYRLEKMEKELGELHHIWYPAITEVVGVINENFSKFFDMMGFVGEVELVRKEERDYSDYGIAIRVQYRDSEKLQALSRHVQSGGERAVAIAVYTLSLQHITSVPFRCVDEINQGMDPNNERKIFQMLVDITCQPNQSQYFFVTPKLLSDLPYNDFMEIHVVHNGAHIEDPFIFLSINDMDQEDE